MTKICRWSHFTRILAWTFPLVTVMLVTATAVGSPLYEREFGFDASLNAVFLLLPG